MMEHWRLRAGLDRGMGLGVGAGPMMLELASVPPGHGPKKALGEGLDVLAACIKNGVPGKTGFCQSIFRALHTVWQRRRIEAIGARQQPFGARPVPQD